MRPRGGRSLKFVGQKEEQKEKNLREAEARRHALVSFPGDSTGSTMEP